MIVIVCGVAKSGTNWMRHMVNDMIVQSGGVDISHLRKHKKNMDNILVKEVNRIGRFTWKRTIYLAWMSITSTSFYIYYMGKPDGWIKLLLKLNLVKVVFTFRDPRDMLLSVIDHGKKAINDGDATHHFTKYVEFLPAIGYAKREITTKLKWLDVKHNVIHVKYESLLFNTPLIMKQVAEFLRINISAEAINNIVLTYAKDRISKATSGSMHMHLNKAKSNRYLDELSADQIKVVNIELEHLILKAGYKLG